MTRKNVIGQLYVIMVTSTQQISTCKKVPMIKMRDLNSGFTYRSSWTGYAKGRGLDICNAPVLHSARIDANQVYDDPFKDPRHGFSKK